MAFVLIKREIWTQRQTHTQREDYVKRHRENMVTYKPRRPETDSPSLHKEPAMLAP